MAWLFYIQKVGSSAAAKNGEKGNEMDKLRERCLKFDSDLVGFTIDDILLALCDGEYLAKFKRQDDIWQDEVETLYHDLKIAREIYGQVF